MSTYYVAAVALRFPYNKSMEKRSRDDHIFHQIRMFNRQIKAENLQEAEALALKKIQEEAPASDGWVSHRVVSAVK